jgi:hypothetical protein
LGILVSFASLAFNASFERLMRSLGIVILDRQFLDWHQNRYMQQPQSAIGAHWHFDSHLSPFHLAERPRHSKRLD